MELKQLPIEQVKPYWRNPRKNDAAVAAVKESIRAFGFNQPIAIDPEGVIIAGHTRYRAARELELTTVPCVVLDLDGQRATAYRIADNKTAELAEWDMEALIPELRTIDDIEGMQDFFPDEDLGALLRGTAGVTGMASVNAADMQRVQRQMQERFEGSDGDAQAKELVQVTCPHCAADFGVSIGLLQSWKAAQNEIDAAKAT